jgi:Ca2+-binding RTX toxin-like protein
MARTRLDTLNKICAALGLDEAASDTGELVDLASWTEIASQFKALLGGEPFRFADQDDAGAETSNQTASPAAANTEHADPSIQSGIAVAETGQTNAAGGIDPGSPDTGQVVIGVKGIDTLVGTPQADQLLAATGFQTMTGLGGADQFVFGIAATRGLVTDFEVGVDQLVFNNAGGLDWDDVDTVSVNGTTYLHVGEDWIILPGVNSVSAQDVVFNV